MTRLQMIKPRKAQSAKRRTRPARRLAVEALESRLLLSGDMVLQWNEVLLDAIRAERTPPPIAARNMAIVHVAIYDAVNSIFQTHEPYAVRRQGPPRASPEAAVAAAAHRTLGALFPGQRSTFDAALAASLAEIPDGPAENQGVALGQSVAQRILALRRHDGSDEEVSYTPGTEPGDWQPTPPGFLPALLPQWPLVKPFAMTSGSQFRPAGSPELTSSEYTAAFDEVKELGEQNSPTRTADQTEIALFWADGPGTATPPGHWNEIAQDIAELRGNTLAENARLFALLNIAVSDAGVSAWDAKYVYNFWRPVAGIRAADLDGNPATAPDADWTPLIVTPPFPSYTSGHSTFSAAAATILADFYGANDIGFTTTSEGLPGVTRSFASFSAAAQEAGRSRIYGGIHWEFDNADALASGEALGRYVFQNFLAPQAQPVHALRSPARPGAAVVPIPVNLRLSLVADSVPSHAAGGANQALGRRGQTPAPIPSPATETPSDKASSRSVSLDEDQTEEATQPPARLDALDSVFGSLEPWEWLP